MRFLVFILPAIYQPVAGKLIEPNGSPTVQMIEKMGRFNDELKAAGAVLALDGLQPLTKGARLAFSENDVQVTEGSQIDAKEVIGGYWLLQADARRQVIDWMKRCPVQPGDLIEIRQVAETSDFPPEVQAVIRAR